MASNSPSTNHDRKRLFLLAKEFIEVFHSHQFQPIPLQRLIQAYQSKHRKNFSPRQLQYRSLEQFVDEFPIFSRDERSSVTLSRSGLLNFFFQPVLMSCGGSAKPKELIHHFESCTGVKLEVICQALQLEDSTMLISVLTSESDQFELKMVAPNSQQSIVGFRSSTYTGVERTNLQKVASPIQGMEQSPNRGHGPRVPSRLDSDEYPALHRTLLPNPSCSVVGGPSQPRRPPPPQPQSLQQGFEPLKLGASVDSIPPQYWNNPFPPLLPPPPPPHGDGVNLIHHPPVSPHRGGTPFNTSSVHHGYLPLSPSSSPSLTPGPRGPIVPQVITTNLPMVKPRSPTISRQPPPTDLDQKFPHPNVEFWRESILPSHSTFRPNLPVPQIPPGVTILPVSRKRRESVEAKQKVIEKINAKAEDLISDLSSQGKFLQPDTIRTLVLEMVKSANQGRPYTDKINQRDISAMANYSKVHGRIEELIRVFCWFCPVTSLYELEQAIVDSEKVDSYEALQLGPITKHPRVVDLFKLQEASTLDSVPDMSAYKIHNYLMKFISRTKQRGAKHSVEDFLEYVREKEFAESVYHLCIRITSFPLAIQVGSIIFFLEY